MIKPSFVQHFFNLKQECMILNRDRTAADFIIDFTTLLIFSLPTSSTLWKHVTNNQGKLWWWLGSQKNEQALIQRSLKLLVHANSHRWTPHLQRSFSLSILMICSNDLSPILSFMPMMTIILRVKNHYPCKKSHHHPSQQKSSMSTTKIVTISSSFLLGECSGQGIGRGGTPPSQQDRTHHLSSSTFPFEFKF